MEETRFAFLIGLSDYRYNSVLSFSGNDVENFASALINLCNFDQNNIEMMVSTKEDHNDIGLNEILERVRSIKNKFVVGNDVILFYFSGHGEIIDNEYNLDLDSTKVPLGSIFNEIKTLAPKYLIIILDSCHSGKVFEFKGGEDITLEEYFNKMYKPNQDGFYLLASSHEKQKSLAYKSDQMSLYTKHLLKEIFNQNNYLEGVLPLESVHAIVRVNFERKKLQIPHMQITGGGFEISKINWRKMKKEKIPLENMVAKDGQEEEGRFNYRLFRELRAEVNDILSKYDSIVIGSVFNDFTEKNIEIQWYNNREFAAEAIADNIFDEDGVDWNTTGKMRRLNKALLMIKSFGELTDENFWFKFYEEFPEGEWVFDSKEFWEKVFDISMRFR